MDSEHDALDALWQRVLEDWDNASAHEALVQLAYDTEQLGRVAGFYKSQIEDEARGEIARKKLGAVAMLAMQLMESSKTEPAKKAPRWLLVAAAAVCALGVGVLLYALST